MARGKSAFRAFLLSFIVLLALLATGGLAQSRESSVGATTSAVLFVRDLPREAQETIALVRKGGPFPYDRDGVVFGNYERLLPPRARGYYREYTVPTPGVRSRGARRIVQGRAGEIYYTDDHYRTFRQVKE